MSATETIMKGQQQPEEETDGTLNPPEELTAEPGTVLFMSKVHNLIVTVFPHLREQVGGGQRDINGGGYRLQFVNHQFKVNAQTRREHVAFMKRHGKHHAIDDEDLQTLLEQPLEDWLRAHPNFKSNNPDGFYEVVAPIPEPSAELVKILEAALAGDEETLERIQDDELAGHKREKILDACQKALEQIYLSRAGAAISGPQAPAEPPTE